MMIRIPVRAAVGQYDVLVGPGLLGEAGRLIKEASLQGAVRILADERVYQLYGRALEDALGAEAISFASFQIPSGESSKSLQMASKIYDWLIENRTERRDLVVALGGGVVGDLAGFVAATYLRGLRLVQIPTSLLAQVDSSVGGKVAVNHPLGKNLIGSFYPPVLVVADTSTLSSLPLRELSAALAEIAKMGIIMDRPLFERLETEVDLLLGLDSKSLVEVIARTVELKAWVVQQDERESGLRAILNYGHSYGHAVEAVTDYRLYRHGEAVAIGMVGAGRIAQSLGMIDAETASRQETLLTRMGIPVRCPRLPVDRLLEAMTHDKKASEGKLSWVLLEGIGKVTVRRDVQGSLVRQVLEGMVS